MPRATAHNYSLEPGNRWADCLRRSSNGEEYTCTVDPLQDEIKYLDIDTFVFTSRNETQDINGCYYFSGWPDDEHWTNKNNVEARTVRPCLNVHTKNLCELIFNNRQSVNNQILINWWDTISFPRLIHSIFINFHNRQIISPTSAQG